MRRMDGKSYESFPYLVNGSQGRNSRFPVWRLCRGTRKRRNDGLKLGIRSITRKYKTSIAFPATDHRSPITAKYLPGDEHRMHARDLGEEKRRMFRAGETEIVNQGFGIEW